MINKHNQRIFTALLSLVLTILFLGFGTRIGLLENGSGRIDYGFPAKSITYIYLPHDDLAYYAPMDVTPFVWIRNLGITFSRSSFDLLGLGINLLFYYLFLRFVFDKTQQIVKKLKTWHQ